MCKKIFCKNAIKSSNESHKISDKPQLSLKLGSNIQPDREENQNIFV